MGPRLGGHHKVPRELKFTPGHTCPLQRREDHRISTVRRYVTALGGQLEIVAIVDGKRILLSAGA